jgi:hypothetical protein
MAAHSYWGIKVTGINYPAWSLVIAELVMRDANEVSLCTGGAAHASPAGQYDPVRIFNSVPPTLSGNDLPPFFASAFPFPGEQLLYYAFSSAVDVTAYELYVSPYISERPKTWEFVYSDDGVNWTVADTQTNYDFGAGLDNNNTGQNVLGYALFDIVIPPVFTSTPPTTPPETVAVIGAETLVGSMGAAPNLFTPAGSYGSVVIDINAPETPKHGSY